MGTGLFIPLGLAKKHVWIHICDYSMSAIAFTWVYTTKTVCVTWTDALSYGIKTGLTSQTLAMHQVDALNLLMCARV